MARREEKDMDRELNTQNSMAMPDNADKPYKWKVDYAIFYASGMVQEHDSLPGGFPALYVDGSCIGSALRIAESLLPDCSGRPEIKKVMITDIGIMDY